VKRVFKNVDGLIEVLEEINLPLLINVPIIYPRGGGFSLTFPIKKGDECLIVFNERSIDNWHAFGTIKKPNDRRFHSLSDAVVHVGLSSLVNKVPNYDSENVVLKKDDDSATITIKNNSDIDVVTTSNVNVSCTDINVNATGEATVTCPESEFIGNVTVTGELLVTKDITCAMTVRSVHARIFSMLMLGNINIENHVHSQSSDDGGDSQQNTGGPQIGP